jgi:hypothetical protein
MESATTALFLILNRIMNIYHYYEDLGQRISLFSCTDMLVDNLIASKQLEESLKDKVLDTLYLRHHHQYQKKHHEDGSSSRFQT